jgi:hypothetical protein
MSSDKDKKHKADRLDGPRAGSVVPEDADLATWLHAFWARGEYPERIEVRQIIRGARGELVHHQDFRANDPQNIEQVTKLANEILAACQHDCDVAERKRAYQVDVIDRNRKAHPVVRGIGPLQPSRRYLVKPEDLDDDEEGDPLTGKGVSLAYINRMYVHLEHKESALNQILGDALTFQRDTITEQRAWIASLTANQIKFFLELQDALDRRDERAVGRAMTELKVEFLRDGRRLGRNLLVSLFGAEAAEQGQLPGSGATKRPAFSPVRELLDGFLHDCQEAKIDVALFGEWAKDDQGKVVPVTDKPGIFTPQQVGILVSVRDGNLPVEALDEIVPGLGGKHEISIDQMVRAQPLITEGIGQALVQIKRLCETRRASRQASSSARPEAS